MLEEVLLPGKGWNLEGSVEGKLGGGGGNPGGAATCRHSDSLGGGTLGFQHKVKGPLAYSRPLPGGGEYGDEDHMSPVTDEM